MPIQAPSPILPRVLAGAILVDLQGASHYGGGKKSDSRDISVLFDFFKYKSYISLKFPQDQLQWVPDILCFHFYLLSSPANIDSCFI